MTKGAQWSVKHRPKTLDDFIGAGNEAARSKTARLLKNRDAHAVLFYGESGCGKTTLARIVAETLSDGCKSDVTEFNIGTSRGIDDIRNIVSSATYLPRRTCKVILCEEAHALTSQAKSAFLRPLEDPPHDKVVFLLCTDRPWLLDQQIINRTFQIGVVKPYSKELASMLLRVAKEEGVFRDYSSDERKKLCLEIAKASDDVPRSALQLLQAAVSSYKQYDNAEEFIAASIKTTTAATMDKSALLILGCIYSGAKPLDERIPILVKSFGAYDAMGLLTRIMHLNHQLLIHVCGGESPQAKFYLVKELTPIKGIPTVGRATRVATQLAELKNSLATVNMDPAAVILPRLLGLAIELTKDKS